MEVSNNYGISYNSSKCKIKQKQISFYGAIWDENGVHQNPDKCDNIKNRPPPKKSKNCNSF